MNTARVIMYMLYLSMYMDGKLYLVFVFFVPPSLVLGYDKDEENHFGGIEAEVVPDSTSIDQRT